MVVLPVLVRVEPASTAKLLAVPRPTVAVAAVEAVGAMMSPKTATTPAMDNPRANRVCCMVVASL
jgi:hypothetical protein